MPDKPKESRGKRLLNIFLSTLKIGAFTFGGGYAMIPLMEREFVDKHGWIERQDILDIFAIGQSVPGVIAINTSVMIGYRAAGLPGALMGALGVSLPSLIILSLVTLIYQQFIANEWVQAAMRGVRAGVVALILSAVLRMSKSAVKDGFQWVLLFGALFLSIAFPDISAIFIILGGGLIGFIVDRFFRKDKAKEGKA